MTSVSTMEVRLNVTRSSLEEMLEAIRKRDEKPKDVPPALPARPVSKARLPSARRSLPNDFKIGEGKGENLSKKRDREEEDKGEGGETKMVKLKLVVPAESPYDNGEENGCCCGGGKWLEKKCNLRVREVVVDEVGRDGGAEINKEFQVWCQLSNGQWESGSIQSNSAEDAQVMLSDGSVATVPMENVLPSNPDILDGVDDLIQLSYLNEPSVLHNVESRYCRDKLYTKAGRVLVAMNPFKDVQLQNNDLIEAYKQKLVDGPHVYAIVDAAFSEMMRDEANQSIIISGESGAGKTETAKTAMHYLSVLGGGSELEKKILQANYILESFGNAKTSLNRNSSRFGKLIEIHFTPAGKICGAKIETFLLEKSRVVQLAKGERSYHIFYQLCAGAPSFLKERLNLKTAGKYAMLRQSKCMTIDDIDDAQKFQMLKEALNVVQICKEEQENVFAMLSAVLWLGNISFQVIGDHVDVMKDEAVTTAAKLMGCKVEDLISVLSTRRIRSSNDTVVQNHTMPQAIETRDALAKHIYEGVFECLVERINMSLEVGKVATRRSISIVDITGFESVQSGCFEQFCGNYANERLQQHFNRHLFKLQQEEYRQDGIDWTKVDFEDNQECLNLFEQKPFGLLSLLDEECGSQETTDLTFASKLKQHLDTNTCFKGEKDGTFIVSHSAGEVTYNSSDFLMKNRDHLYSDSIELLNSCTCQLPRLLATHMLGSSDSQMQNLGSKLKGRLFKLMQQLECTTPHFIRCIKTNSKQVPGIFEKDLVLRQLRHCGVLDVVRISRFGYSTGLTHQQFAKRYSLLLSKNVASQEPLSMSIAILQKFNVHPDMFQVGYTKLFVRAGQIAVFEDARRRMLRCIINIQKCIRGHLERRYLKLKKRTSATAQQSCHAAQEIGVFSDQQSAVIFLQSVIRGWLVRRNSHKMQKLVKTNLGITNANSLTYEITPNFKNLEHDQTSSVLAEFQRRVLKAEAVVKQTDDENVVLKQQLKQFEMKWSEYEEKVKSMEEMWQRKITTLQTSLAAVKSGVVADEAMAQTGTLDASPLHYYDSEDTASPGTHTPEACTPVKLPSRSSDPTSGRGSNGLNAVNHLAKEFDQQKQLFNEDAKFLVEVRSGNPHDELRKLKQNFEAWKKDFRVKLRDTKTSLNKFGIADSRHRKTWWGIMSSRRS